MQDLDDIALLREYVERGSEAAFSTLVARDVSKVYSVALRHTGNAHQAEDITQAVFVILATKARRLSPRAILSGWLYQTARLTALTFVRGEIRRARREQEASMQISLNENSSNVWGQIAPFLDSAMAALSDRDRHAVVLRFFDGKSMKEVGAALGASEDAARVRIHRAVEKMRRFYLKRGLAVSAAIMTTAISTNSVQAAPLLLTQTVTTVALAKGATASTSTLSLIHGALNLMAWTKLKTAVAAGAALLLAAGTTTTMAVVRSNAQKTEKLWRANKNMSHAQIASLPPLDKVLPTKFVDSPWSNWSATTNGDKFVGASAGARIMTAYAYAMPQGRIRFLSEPPTNRFDFAVTLPRGSREVLRREVEKKLGLIGRRVTETTNVLLLRVRYPNAPGLKPAIPGVADTYMKVGAYHSSNAAIDTGPPVFEGLAHFLENYFRTPVIDQTGMTQRYGMDLRWKEQNYRENPEGLKQSLLERLGLELVPARRPVEFLLVDKAR